MHLVSFHISYEFEYFYQCIILFRGLRDSRGTYGCIKPIQLKIDDIDLKGRFVNLFGNFSPLCGAAPVNVIKTVLGVQENKRVQQMNPDIHRRTKLLPLPVLIHTETFATNFVSFISNTVI